MQLWLFSFKLLLFMLVLSARLS